MSALQKTLKPATNMKNKYVMWNDQPGGGGVAHDKGFMIWDDHSGVLVHHSAPNWPSKIDDDEFIELQEQQPGRILRKTKTMLEEAGAKLAMDAFENGAADKTPGLKTNLSQHFLLVTLTIDEVKRVLVMLSHAKANFHNNRRGDIPHLTITQPVVNNKADAHTIPDMITKKGLTIFPKSHFHHFNYWEKFADLFCQGEGKRMRVWTHSQENLSKQVDIHDRPGKGSSFGYNDWSANHMKLGRCYENPVVGIAGWNHSGQTHMKRGSMFFAIESKKMHESFTKLFPN